jgi:hypothetical protein
VGSAPELSDQVYGGVPPLAERVALYGVPTMIDGSDVVVIVRGETVAVPTLIPSDFEVLCAGEAESVSRIVKL